MDWSPRTGGSKEGRREGRQEGRTASGHMFRRVLLPGQRGLGPTGALWSSIPPRGKQPAVCSVMPRPSLLVLQWLMPLRENLFVGTSLFPPLRPSTPKAREDTLWKAEIGGIHRLLHRICRWPSGQIKSRALTVSILSVWSLLYAQHLFQCEAPSRCLLNIQWRKGGRKMLDSNRMGSISLLT